MSDPVVLVIEDDVALRRCLTRELRRLGAVVQAVGTAATALDMLRQHRPDCILLDLGLPDSEPDETVALIDVLARYAPVIVVTGNAGWERRSYQAGARRVCHKGGSPRDIAQIASLEFDPDRAERLATEAKITISTARTMLSELGRV